MNIEKVRIESIKSYENNAKRHTKKQIEQIKKSIKDFGYNDPIALDENNMIIEGHGRYEALKQLNYKEIDCIRLDNLTEQQKKAYILAHNKLNMETGFNNEILVDELNSILDFNMEDFGFNIELIGFNYAKTSKEKNVGIHFYLDDYQFERVWNKPEDYIETLKQYECILSPDFSLYMDMPMPMKIWNIYRSRQIGQYYQNQGIKVIPTLSWAEKETFDFCFEGIPEGSIVSISTIGVKKNKEALKIWKDGVDELIKRIKPSAILIYGGKLDYDYGDIKVVYYDNKVTERLKK